MNALLSYALIAIPNFLGVSKKARDMVSRKAELSPKLDEALQLVSSAVSFVMYLAALSTQ